MKYTLLICFLFISILAFAQDESVKKLQSESSRNIKKEADSLPHKWRTGGIFNINVAQGSLSNWAAGGDNFSLSLNSLVSLYAFYKKDKHSWDNTLDFNFGYINTTTLGARKNDDRLDLLSKYGFSISKHVNLTTLFNFRTQFFRGYTYTDTSRIFTSSFLAPGYIIVSEGFDYKPTENLSIFVSPITTRWVIVKNDSLAAQGLYGVPAGHHSINEIGAFASINYIKTFSKVFAYKVRLDLFSNYKHDPQYVDVNLSNLLAMKLTEVLAVTWNVDLIYDHDVQLFGKNHDAPAVQFKSQVGIGLLFKFKK
jgi:hypothetical protein